MARVAIYLPTKADRYAETLQLIKRSLSDKFGGCTTYNHATGVWENEDGDVIEEPVTVIESYGSDVSPPWVQGLARRVKDHTGEESVGYVIDESANMGFA